MKATRVDSDYARGYLAAKGVRYDGPDPVEFLNGYLLQRNDAAGAKCDPKKGWVRGPGGKCVRAKDKEGSARRGMASAMGAATLAAGLGAYAFMNGKKKRPQLPGAATPGQLSGANPAQRQLPAARG